MVQFLHRNCSNYFYFWKVSSTKFCDILYNGQATTFSHVLSNIRGASRNF